MPVEDARGFTISEQGLQAIVVNAADARRARIFTLFHEYAHLLLHQPGICNPDLSARNGHDHWNVEQWCNRFAGALLIPKEVVETDDDFRSAARAPEAISELLGQLSARYKVSTQVILTRMLTCGLISRRRYEVELSRQKASAKPPKKTRPFGPSPTRRCLQEKGRLFVSLVLEGRRTAAITYSDVADYLSLRVKHFDQLQALIGE
jgi:Zn-dependent peptidase ImmA (M78 family)